MMNARNQGRIVALAAVWAVMAAQFVASTALAAPAPPQLSSPDTNVTVDTLSPTLSWHPSAEAQTYVAEVADNPSFNSRQSSPWSASLSFTPALTGNSTWYWRVKASGQSGTSDYSETRHLWTKPTLSAPADGAAVSVTPKLDWVQYKTRGSLSDPTRRYRVQIASDAAFGTIVLDQTIDGSGWGSNTFTVPPPGLAPGHTYHWRISVSSDDGASGWSDARRFFAGPPSPATLTAPADGVLLDNWRPTLTWTPAEGATSYRVHYVRTGSTERTSGDLTTTSFVLDTFWGGDSTAESSTYEWWVEAKNVNGSTSSAHWTFHTPARATPPTPELLAPADGATVAGLVPAFDWSDTTHTKNYKIQVGTGATPYGITGQVAGPTVTDSNYSYPEADYVSIWPLEYNTTYYWQVTAISIGYMTASSPIRSFRTPPPPGPSLVEPADGSTLPDGVLRPTLSWGSEAGAQSYQVELSTNPTFTPPLVAQETIDAASGSSLTLAVDLDYDALYYWRVRFVDGKGASNWSAAWSFRGPPPPIPFSPSLITPGSPSLDSPPSIAGFRPIFDWSDQGGATYYGFQLARDAQFTSKVVDLSVEPGLSSSSYTLDTDLSPSTVYYWRAFAANRTGTSPWSNSFAFVTPPPPPVAPTLLTPARNSQIAVLKPHFDWSDSPGATSYTFELYADSWRSTLVESATVQASEYDAVADLTPNTIYYWQVRAANETSGAGPWSSLNSFQTPPAPAPAKPALVAPEDGATVDTLLPTLDWEDDPNSGNYSISYRVQLSENPLFSGTLAANQVVPGSSYTPASWAPLKKGTTYYWRVQGINGGVNGEWSDSRSFLTPTLPGVPSLADPANGTALDTLTPTLSVSPVAGATGYEAQVSTASWFPSGTSTVVVRSSSPLLSVTNSLKYGTTYYWRARAANAAGQSNWSSYWTFATPPPPPPPAAPTLLQPTDGALVGSARPTLDWDDVPNATKYRVEWSKSSTFQWTEASRDNLTQSTFILDVDLEYDKQYYWRVRATGDGGDGPYSAIYGFRTPAGPPAAVTLLAPENSGVADSPLQRFDWADSLGAESYRFQISTDSTFLEPLVVDETTTASEFTLVSPLAANTSYFWRVAARNGVGDAPWSETWSFTVPEAPEAVSPLSPAQGELLATLRPVLTWDAADRAAYYEVRYARSTAYGDWVEPVRVVGTSFAVTVALVRDADYSWQVRAVNGGGTGPWSPVRTFHTPLSAAEPPTAPNLLAPADQETLTTVTPTFTWDASLEANGYHLQVSTDSGFGAGVLDHFTSATSLALATPLDYSTTYYWRVQATNNLGTTNSVTRSFTTPAPPAPPAPSLVLPEDGSTVSSLVPTFDWTDDWEARRWTSGYRLQISTTQDFGSFVFNNTVQGGSEFVLPSWVRLSHSTSYYWRVQGFNNAGSGDWSAVAGFRTPDPPPAPTAPILVAPGGLDAANPTVVDSLKPRFTWQPSSDAASYRIQISKNAQFTSLLVNATTNSTEYAFEWQTLTKGAQYWWRVQGVNHVGAGDWSTVFTFKAPTVPAVPTLVEPSNGAKDVSASPVLDWSDVDGATGYLLMVGTNTWFGTKVIDTTVSGTSSYTPTAALTPGTYYWKVAATNGAGTSNWSPTWSFTVPSGTTPPPGGDPAGPTLLSPGGPDGGTVETIDTLKPAFSWTPVEGATSYRIQVSRNVGFTMLAVNTTTSETSYSAPSWVSLSKGTRHWWRVQAIGSAGTGPWSTLFTFTTPSIPGVPTLVAPVGGATASSLTPTLDWEDVAGATSYRVQVGTNPWFGTNVVDTNVTGASSHTPASNLAPAKTYYWRVNASNVAGTSNWSATGSFVTPSP